MTRIVIKNYSSGWKEVFESEAKKLREVFANGDNPQIEHIGSTSVEGLDAKPIIDIMIGFEILNINQTVEKIEALGYEHWYEDTFRDTRLFFTKWDALKKERLIHIHATIIGNSFWNDQLNFRNKLRTDPALAQRYVQLKKDLAKKYGEDRDSYTQAKTEFVRSVLI